MNRRDSNKCYCWCCDLHTLSPPAASANHISLWETAIPRVEQSATVQKLLFSSITQDYFSRSSSQHVFLIEIYKSLDQSRKWLMMTRLGKCAFSVLLFHCRKMLLLTSKLNTELNKKLVRCFSYSSSFSLQKNVTLDKQAKH